MQVHPKSTVLLPSCIPDPFFPRGTGQELRGDYLDVQPLVPPRLKPRDPGDTKNVEYNNPIPTYSYTLHIHYIYTISLYIIMYIIMNYVYNYIIIYIYIQIHIYIYK